MAGAKISPCVPSELLGSTEVTFSTPCLWAGRGSHPVLSHPVLGPDSWTPPLLSWPYTLLLALSVTVQRPRTRGAPVAPSLGFHSTHGSGPFESLSERQPLPAHACSDSLLPGRQGLYLTPSKPLSSIDKDSNPQGPHLIVGLQEAVTNSVVSQRLSFTNEESEVQSGDSIFLQSLASVREVEA